MEVIKKKMQNLREKLEGAESEASKAENELDSTNEAADKKEEEAKSLLQTLSDLEDELDNEEDRLTNLKMKYDEAVKLADENERAHKELHNRGQTDNSKLGRLQREDEELHTENDELEVEYQEVLAKLEEAEIELEEEEDRFSTTDLRVKELEVEAVQIGNLLRSMEINEENAAKSQTSSFTKLEVMKESLSKITARAEEKESESQSCDEKLVEFDERVHDSREKYQSVKADYDALLAEVAEI